ncbi:MAG: prolipoprotein diacylglyceryl transferase [Clostridiales bacterium]|jgi:phosphatidylglycerol:prolipoprotein diacylglycerol transferase|nr:prolipoprotein diacylglyceryl transferase [Clostridiales bacterium]
MSISRELFSIGGFSVHLFGVMVALGILSGAYTAVRMAEKKGIREEIVMDLMLYLLLGGVIGARILYVLQNIRIYGQNPISILYLHQGGLSIHGAIIGGATVVLFYSRMCRISFLKLADALVPGLAIGYAIGRIGCDIFGNITSIPWGVSVGGVIRHPVQLYSALAGYLIFILLLERSKNQRFTGEIFLLFVVAYSVYRFIIEFFRSSGSLFSNAQYISIFAATAGLLLLFSIGKASLVSQKGGA